MLKPLEQFICDKCGQTIENINEGWVEWLTKVDGDPIKIEQWGFKIVHHAAYSPLAIDEGSEGCYHYGDNEHRGDNHLETFMANIKCRSY